MNVYIKELRRKTGLTQKAFADLFGIPLSTLCKWEQGESTPPAYVGELIARALPASDASLEKVVNRDGVAFYYDKAGRRVLDAKGNSITISEELDGVNRQNLAIYLTDLFGDFYQIQSRFDRDCMYDKQEDILWE